MSATRSDYSWQQALDDRERAAVVYAEPGTELEDGDSYLDATSPKRGIVLAFEGEKVPVGGRYICQSQVPKGLWDRLVLAAYGKL